MHGSHPKLASSSSAPMSDCVVATFASSASFQCRSNTYRPRKFGCLCSVATVCLLFVLFFFLLGFHLSILLCCRVNCPFGRESSRCIGGHETAEIIRAMCKADEQGRWAVTELSNTSERCASTGQPWANQCDPMRCTMERPSFPEQ